MMAKVVYETNVTLELAICAECGTTFGIEALLHKRQFREAGKSFYCPNGHRLTYGKGEIDKLKQELAAKEKTLDQTNAALREKKKEVEHEARRAIAYKGVVTRVKNKIARGVCPCCDTYFENLHSHMAEQHPDYEDTDETKPQPKAETGMTIRS